jgi:hypothetical protein
MLVRRSIAALLATGAMLLTVLAPTPTLAATTGVECGVINAYTAPDPLGSTDGSIQFGFTGPVEVIAAAATLDPVVATDLPNYVGNGAITCVDVTADGGGIITAMAFASGGVISGPVTYDSVNDAYIVADRIFAPASQLVTQPELVPVILVPFEAGEPLTVTLTVDSASGNLTGVSTFSQVSGPVAFSGGGDLLIDGATLPAAYVTGNARLALQVADGTGSDADVSIDGGLDTNTGDFLLSLGVDTIGCSTVDARSSSSITIDGVAFALGSGSTAAASLTTGVEVGVRLQVALDDSVTITEVTVPGCGSVAPVAPPETDTDTSEPMSALADFSSILLLVAVLACWYAAAVVIRRRTARPSRDD